MNKFWVCLGCLVCVVSILGFCDAQDATTEADDAWQTQIVEVKQTARNISAAFRDAATEIGPAVVVILAKRADVNETLDQLQLLDENAKNFSAGSGVIVSSDGLIVTNNHVVTSSSEIRVRLADGREFVATDVRTDESTDMAILKIKTPDALPAAAFGDSSKTEVGDWVIAVGSPFLLEQTVSAGIISGKGRALRGMVSGQLLQTDASINPGNSGGALANLDGELVGINTAIASGSGTFEGVGFAIPSNRVQWIVSELRDRGVVRRAALGVTTVEIPREIAMQNNLPLRDGGAYVARVRPGSPAAEAGLKTGDIILKYADQAIHNPLTLAQTAEQSAVAQPVVMIVLRDGKNVEVSVTPEARN